MGPLLAFTAVFLLGFSAIRRLPSAAVRSSIDVTLLPDVMEALALCADAGLDTLRALERILAAAPEGPFVDALRRTAAEAQAGAGKAEAWRRLAERVPHEEVRLWVGVLVRGETLGAGSAAALRDLATGIRERRYLRAERRALEAPVRLLLPMGCAFLAVLTLLGGALWLDFAAGGLP